MIKEGKWGTPFDAGKIEAEADRDLYEAGLYFRAGPTFKYGNFTTHAPYQFRSRLLLTLTKLLSNRCFKFSRVTLLSTIV